MERITSESRGENYHANVCKEYVQYIFLSCLRWANYVSCLFAVHCQCRIRLNRKQIIQKGIARINSTVKPTERRV